MYRKVIFIEKEMNGRREKVEERKHTCDPLVVLGRDNELSIKLCLGRKILDLRRGEAHNHCHFLC